MLDSKTIRDLVERLSAVLPPGLGAVGDDVRSKMEEVLCKGFAELDLLSREEFAATVERLARAEERIAELEKILAEIDAQGVRKGSGKGE